MDGSARPQARRRRRRADAEQNVTAILQAATNVLTARPEASVEDVAQAAGVSRQTVYAHFASREALLNAIIEQGTAEVSAAFETAGLEEVPPAEALIRLLNAGWQVSARYPFLWNLPEVSPDEDLDRHGPVVERLHEIVRRGQQSGDFDRRVSATWLIAAGMAIGRAAQDEVKAGRMTVEDATRAVNLSFFRLFGVQDPTPG